MSTLNDFGGIRKVIRIHKGYFVLPHEIESEIEEEVELRQLGPNDIIHLNEQIGGKFISYKVIGQPYPVIPYGSEFTPMKDETPLEDRAKAVWQVDLDP